MIEGRGHQEELKKMTLWQEFSSLSKYCALYS